MPPSAALKIGFFEAEGWEEPVLRQAFPVDSLYLSPDRLAEDALPAERDFDALAVFVNSKINSGVLKEFPNLKLVTTRSTGYDHVDARTCTKRGVAAAYVPGYGDNTVAEFAFGLLLALTRKIYLGIDQVKERGLFSFEGLRGVDLARRTMGVVGTGRIGRHTIKIARGFEMNVLAYDPRPDQAFAAAAGFVYKDLPDLLKESDAVTLHCPYNKATHHLLNHKNIGLMKKGAYLINTARGGLVETDALVEALQEGRLAGAGLDVLEEEGDVKDEVHFLAAGHPRREELRVLLENHILMKMPNVLITPHNAFNSKEALERILRTTIENIQSFFAGKPVNLIP